MPVDIAQLQARISADDSDFKQKAASTGTALTELQAKGQAAAASAHTAIQQIGKASQDSAGHVSGLANQIAVQGRSIEETYRQAFTNAERSAYASLTGIENKATETAANVGRAARAIPAAFSLEEIPSQFQSITAAAQAATAELANYNRALTEAQVQGARLGSSAVSRPSAPTPPANSQNAVPRPQEAGTAASASVMASGAASAESLSKEVAGASESAGALSKAFTEAGTKIEAALSGAIAQVKELAAEGKEAAEAVATGLAGVAGTAAGAVAGATEAVTKGAAKQAEAVKKSIADELAESAKRKDILIADDEKVVGATVSHWRGLVATIKQSWNNAMSVVSGQAAITFSSVTDAAVNSSNAIVAEAYAQAEHLSAADAQILLSSERVIEAQKVLAEAAGEAAEKIARVQEAVEATTETFERLSDLALGIDAIAGEAAHLSIEFDEVASKTKNNTNLMAGDYDELKQHMIDLSSATGQSFESIGDAYTNAIQQGYTLADATKVVATVNKDAMASQQDLGAETNDVTNLMAAYGAKASEAGKYTNLMHQISIDTGQSMDALQGSFKRIIPIASALGISMTDVGAAMNAAYTSGQDPIQAGRRFTDFARMITTPTPQILKAIQTLKELNGVDLTPDFSRSALQNKGLEKILADIRAATKGDPDLMNKIMPGVRGGVEAMLLTSQRSDVKYGKEKEKLTESFNEGDKGINERNADVLAEPGRQMKIAVAQVSNMLIPIGDKLAKMFLEAVPGIKMFMTGVVDALKVLVSIPDALQVIFISFGAFKLMSFALGDIFAGIGKEVAEVAKNLIGAKGLMVNAEAGIVGAEKAGAEGAVTGAGANTKLAASYDKVAASAKAAAGAEVAAGKGGAASAVPAVIPRAGGSQAAASDAALAAAGIGEAEAALPKVAEESKGAMAAISASFTSAGEAMTGLWATITAGAAGIAEGLGSMLLAFAPFLLVAAAIAAVAFLIYKAWTTDFGHIREYVAEFTAWITPKLKGTWETVKADAVSLWTEIQPALNTLWQGVKLIFAAIGITVLTQVKGWVMAFLIVKDAVNFQIENLKGWRDVAVAVFNAVRDNVLRVVNDVKRLIHDWTSGAADDFKQLTGQVGFLQEAFQRFSDFNSALWGGIVGAMQSAINKITALFGGLGTAIATVWNNLPFVKYLADKSNQANGIIGGGLQGLADIPKGPYGAQVQAEVAAHGGTPGLSANLIMAQMKQESSYQAGPSSFTNDRNGGTYGLLQVNSAEFKKYTGQNALAATGYDREGASGNVRNPNNPAYNPELNIKAGVGLLSDLLTKYHGDQEKALIAYNAGPGRVNNPPASTREYVSHIMATMRELGDNPSASGLGTPGDVNRPAWVEGSAASAAAADVTKQFGTLTDKCGYFIDALMKASGTANNFVVNGALANRALRVGANAEGQYPAGTVFHLNTGKQAGHWITQYQGVNNIPMALQDFNGKVRGDLSVDKMLSMFPVAKDKYGPEAYLPNAALAQTARNMGYTGAYHSGGNENAGAEGAGLNPAALGGTSDGKGNSRYDAQQAADKAAADHKKKLESLAEELHKRVLKAFDDSKKEISDAMEVHTDTSLLGGKGKGSELTALQDKLRDSVQTGDLKGIQPESLRALQQTAVGLDAVNAVNKQITVVSAKLRDIRAAAALPIGATDIQKTEANNAELIKELEALKRPTGSTADAAKLNAALSARIKELQKDFGQTVSGMQSAQNRELSQPIQDRIWANGLDREKRGMVSAAGGRNKWEALGLGPDGQANQNAFATQYQAGQQSDANAHAVDTLEEMAKAQKLVGNAAERAAVQAAGGQIAWDNLGKSQGGAALQNSLRLASAEQNAGEAVAGMARSMAEQVEDSTKRISSNAGTAALQIKHLLETDGAAANDPALAKWIEKTMAAAQALDLSQTTQQIRELNRTLDESTARGNEAAAGDVSPRLEALRGFMEQHKGEFASAQAANKDFSPRTEADKFLKSYDAGETGKSLEAFREQARGLDKEMAGLQSHNPFDTYLNSLKTWREDTGGNFGWLLPPGVTQDAAKRLYDLQAKVTAIKDVGTKAADSITGALSNAMDKGFKGLFTNILMGWQKMLQQMALQKLNERITQGLLGAVSKLAGGAKTQDKDAAGWNLLTRGKGDAVGGIVGGVMASQGKEAAQNKAVIDSLNAAMKASGFVAALTGTSQATVTLNGNVVNVMVPAVKALTLASQDNTRALGGLVTTLDTTAANTATGGATGASGGVGGIGGLVSGIAGAGSGGGAAGWLGLASSVFTGLGAAGIGGSLVSGLAGVTKAGAGIAGQVSSVLANSNAGLKTTPTGLPAGTNGNSTFHGPVGGGSQTAGIVSGRAVGGDMFPGQSYVVGEHGPEMVTAGAGGGRVSSHLDSEEGGGGDTHNHFYYNINTPNAQSFMGPSHTQLMAQAHSEAYRAKARNGQR